MRAFETHLDIQTLIGVFVLVLSLVLLLFGYLLYRFEFLDGKSFFFSRNLGIILCVVSGISAIAAIMMIIYVRIVLR